MKCPKCLKNPCECGLIYEQNSLLDASFVTPVIDLEDDEDNPIDLYDPDQELNFDDDIVVDIDEPLSNEEYDEDNPTTDY